MVDQCWWWNGLVNRRSSSCSTCTNLVIWLLLRAVGFASAAQHYNRIPEIKADESWFVHDPAVRWMFCSNELHWSCGNTLKQVLWHWCLAEWKSPKSCLLYLYKRIYMMLKMAMAMMIILILEFWSFLQAPVTPNVGVTVIMNVGLVIWRYTFGHLSMLKDKQLENI